MSDPLTTITIIKLTGLLQVQSVKTLQQCMHYCSMFYDLEVNSSGDCFCVEAFSYSQSGNDDQYAYIHKLTGNNKLTYQLRPDMNAAISDIELDACGNIYFTGLWNTDMYTSSARAGRVFGRLSPNLTVGWLSQDSTHSKNYFYSHLAVSDFDNFIVNGAFHDTLNLSGVTLTGTNSVGFLAHYSPSSSAMSCLSTGIDGTSLYSSIDAYPNPGQGRFHFSEEMAGSEATIYGADGRLMKTEILGAKELDLTMLDEGIYVILLRQKTETFFTKVVICR
jgi:hypothetical protein